MAIDNTKKIERFPWDGENHKEQGYSEPTITNVSMTISPELLKGNIITTGKDKQGNPINGIENKQITSEELEEGMTIPVKETSKASEIEQGE